MSNDNTQDAAEPSPASAGSHGNDPLAVCCHHLANSQAIIERKNEEIERMRITDDEWRAIAYYIGTGGPESVDATLLKLLERTR
jgi:hypothetical protein